MGMFKRLFSKTGRETHRREKEIVAAIHEINSDPNVKAAMAVQLGQDAHRLDHHVIPAGEYDAETVRISPEFYGHELAWSPYAKPGSFEAVAEVGGKFADVPSTEGVRPGEYLIMMAASASPRELSSRLARLREGVEIGFSFDQKALKWAKDSPNRFFIEKNLQDALRLRKRNGVPVGVVLAA